MSLLMNAYINKTHRHESSFTIPSEDEMEINDKPKQKRRKKNKNN